MGKRRETAVTSANDVARYFLASVDEDAGDIISNLKLQKLCYYAQGFHLAIYDAPLFPDAVLAWQHGPVVRDVWDTYREHEADSIPKPTGADFSALPEQAKELLDDVYESYGQYSAWKLRDLTHEEPPWLDAWTSGREVISPAAMHDYFETLVDPD